MVRIATRRESVVLSLQDDLSPGMLRAAAATKLLERELNSLSKSGTVVNRRLDTLSSRADKVGASFKGMNAELGQSGKSLDVLASSSLPRTAAAADRTDGSINQLTGRLRVLGEVAAILGPTLTPIGGVAIAGIGGLANQMGLAAVAGGVLIGSLQGVGDALGAMNKAQLEPTEKNLEAAHDALKALSPAARDFTQEAFALKPALVALRDLGAEELMPGLTESLGNLERLGPEVAGIMESVAGALGDIAADSSASLASDRWEGFFEFLRTETPRVMGELATTVGDLTHGLSELWQAFEPLNSDFSSWLMGVADSFDGWATGLSATEGFSEFIDYVRETGPQVAETFGAIASAAVQIVQATAPLGGPVLAGVEAFADVVAAIADSDLGTPILAGVAALSLLNRSLAVTASLSKVSLSSGLFAGLGTASKGVKGQAGSIKSDIAAMSDSLVVFGSNADEAGKAAERMKGRLAKGAGLAGLAVAASGAADGLGLTNTMSLALMGSLGGPPGIAIGAAAGALLDVKAAGEGATFAIQGLDAAVQSGDMSTLTEQIAAAKAELADITDLDFGGDIFDRIGFQVADTFGGPSMDDAKAKIEASERALKDLEQQEKLSGIAAKGAALDLLIATDANVDLGKWSGKSTEQIKAQADALTKAQESANETAASFVTLGDSLNDGKVSLGDWIKEMADSADALRNFTANSRTAAKRGLNDGLIESLQQAGEEGARRMRQLANASDSEIGRANAAWRKGQKAMKEYNDYKVPPKKVTADTSRAMQSFREVDQYLSSLDGKRATTYVDTVRTVTGPKGAAAFSQNAMGDLKDRHNPEIASGGSMRIWAEPETQGESYIPHANDYRRPRAKGILEQTASMFGGSVEWFAEGGKKDGKKKPVRGVAFYSPDNTNALQAAIDRLADVASTQTEALEAATSTQEFWAGKMSDLAQATVSGFNTGLFDRDSNPWAAGAGGGPISNLTSDIAGLTERQGLQTQLAGMGLSGDTLAALLSQGTNADISGLIASGQVGQYADLYAQRAALQGSVGGSAANAAYGQQTAAAAAEAAALRGDVQQTNLQLVGANDRLERVEAAIERAAESAPERTGAAAAQGVARGGNDAARRRRRDGGR